MDDFSSTKSILRQNGYTEEVDDRSMPLVAHMLNDIQKLQIKLLSQNANETASENRISILLKELEEVTEQKQNLFEQLESLQKEKDIQNKVIGNLKMVKNHESKPPISMNEYVEMIHSLTMEKDTISKENVKLRNQQDLHVQQINYQSKVIQDQKDQIVNLSQTLHSLKEQQSSLHSYQKQIEEMQAIYHTLQQDLQRQTFDGNACKERERQVSIEIAEVKNRCRLLEENHRSEKNKNLELMESNTHIQSLLDIQKGTVADLENSLNQEKHLSHQLQLKVQSFQRRISDLEQRLRELGGKVDTYQKQVKETEERERETYKQLEEKRKAYDTLVVEQIGNRSTLERLSSENQIQKETVERFQKTQDELDQRIRALQTQEAVYIQEIGKLKNELEGKTRWLKEMEEMLNTERTRSLVEISQLKDALLNKKKPVLRPARNSFPSINATPIKVVDTPMKVAESLGGVSNVKGELNEEESHEGELNQKESRESGLNQKEYQKGGFNEEEPRETGFNQEESHEGRFNQNKFQKNTPNQKEQNDSPAKLREENTIETSTTGLTDVLTNLSNAVNELEQQV